jgi:diamine N-acetyltransferase
VSGEAVPAPDPREAALDATLDTWTDRTRHEDTAAPAPRSVAEGADVQLVEVTHDNVRAICRLVVAPSQRGFVAPNAVSLAEALFAPHAWYRGIAADGVLVGFVMISDQPDGADHDGRAEYYLWRLMIAEGFQGRGYGAAAVSRLLDHVRTRPNATELLVSWVPGPGSPEAFYLGLGFEPTGTVHDGEVEGRLRL